MAASIEGLSAYVTQQINDNFQPHSQDNYSFSTGHKRKCELLFLVYGILKQDCLFLSFSTLSGAGGGSINSTQSVAAAVATEVPFLW